MKLTSTAIDAINEKGYIRNLVAVALDTSESSVRRWVNENEENNDLTKKKALDIISRETGLSETEILTPEPAN